MHRYPDEELGRGNHHTPESDDIPWCREPEQA